MLQVVGIVILILLFLFILLVVNTRLTESHLLNGFWKGSGDFTQQAGVDLFVIYIGEGSILSNVRPGYILIKNDEGLIINNPVEFSFSAGGSLSPNICECREYSVTIDWLGEEGYKFFPTQQNVHYYPRHGKIVFSLNDEVYAILYKDCNMSDTEGTMPNLAFNPDDSEDIDDNIGDSIDENDDDCDDEDI
jgi:hypothetical protein